MTPRPLVALLLLTATTHMPAKELSGRALEKFLGPVSPTLASWQKDVGAGIEIYQGVAKSPLSGHVNITLNLPGWSGPMPVAGAKYEKGRLGVVPVSWRQWTNADGLLFHEAIFGDGDGRQGDVFIYGNREADLSKLAEEISRLPMFNATTSTPFRAMIVRKQIARVVVCVFLPCLFVLSVWLPHRYLRARGARSLPRAITLSLISAAWIPALYFGQRLIWELVHLSSAVQILHGELENLWWLTAAIAIVFFLAGSSTVVWLLVRQAVHSVSANT